MFSTPQRFHFLDASRGLAALAVVCYHWAHFWVGAMGKESTAPSSWFPFYNGLLVFYEYGYYGVDFFFTLSGFVFYWKYSQSISRKEITPTTFFLLRFSRLYPLHILTLLIVAILQYLYFQRHSNYFVFQWNDLYHFFLNFTFTNMSGFEEGNSFNGPTWSIAIEVQLYLLFFCLCFFGVVKKRYIALIASMGLVLMIMMAVGLSFPPYEQRLMFYQGEGMLSFFIGGLVYHGYRWTVEKGNFKLFLNTFLVVFPVITVLTVVEMYSNLYSTSLEKYFGGSLPLSQVNGEGIPIHLLRKWIVTGILFPIIIYTFALIDTLPNNKIGPRISFLGDMSYSSYLLHFPLQLTCVLVFGTDLLLYSLFGTFLIFFFVLIVLSLASYRYFERPMQNAIRRKFL